jgi:ABC-2 type transport system ATP-binding protein
MTTDIAVPAVEVKNVTKNYGPIKALKGISFSVAPGEVVAFLGPNGAGKSTSISLLLGLRRPSSGSIALFGENPRIAKHRKRVGTMLQEAGMPGTLKVQEVVELFSRFHDHPMETREAIKMAGLDEKRQARLNQLSGGQKRRVYFALALVGNPDILFLDEPTTGLDIKARRGFWEQINLQVISGKTIILTTHNLEEADNLAKRIIVINQGEIIADDTPANIKRDVGGKHISFHSPGLTIEAIQRLPEAQEVQLIGEKFELYSKQPELFLSSLLHSQAEINDLEVVGAGLEEAFLALTAHQEEGITVGTR